MMKKIVVNKTGGPEVLELVNSESRSMSAGQIPVDMEATGVDYIEVFNRTGKTYRKDDER
jgi:NADPH:quinone reductase